MVEVSRLIHLPDLTLQVAAANFQRERLLRLSLAKEELQNTHKLRLVALFARVRTLEKATEPDGIGNGESLRLIKLSLAAYLQVAGCKSRRHTRTHT